MLRKNRLRSSDAEEQKHKAQLSQAATLAQLHLCPRRPARETNPQPGTKTVLKKERMSAMSAL